VTRGKAPLPKNSHAAIDVEDEPLSAAARAVDDGLHASNLAAAPLHEVASFACYARDAAGAVIGGAVGRRWGGCCELQQLWVAPSHRRRGLGGRLVRAFEAAAIARGCDTAYLETFSFQAPSLYRSLGYRAAHELACFPHGVVKYLMVRRLAGAAAPAPDEA